MPELDTTECDKLHEVSPISQEIGQFLEWCGEQGYSLCHLQPRRPGSEYEDFCLIGKTIQAVLADYFNIDMTKVEQERRALLESLQKGSSDA